MMEEITRAKETFKVCEMVSINDETLEARSQRAPQMGFWQWAYKLWMRKKDTLWFMLDKKDQELLRSIERQLESDAAR